MEMITSGKNILITRGFYKYTIRNGEEGEGLALLMVVQYMNDDIIAKTEGT